MPPLKRYHPGMKNFDEESQSEHPQEEYEDDASLPHADWNIPQTDDSTVRMGVGFPCLVCKEFAPSKAALKDHYRAKHWTCKHCEHVARGSYQLRLHYARKHNVQMPLLRTGFVSRAKQFACLSNSAETLGLKKWEKHPLDGDGPREPPKGRVRRCFHCREVFPSEDINDHYRNVHWKCCHCDHVAHGTYKLRRHISSCHKEDASESEPSLKDEEEDEETTRRRGGRRGEWNPERRFRWGRVFGTIC